MENEIDFAQAMKDDIEQAKKARQATDLIRRFLLHPDPGMAYEKLIDVYDLLTGKK